MVHTRGYGTTKFARCALVLILFGSTAHLLQGQEPGELRFDLDKAPYLGDGQSRLKIFFRVPYEQLRFTSEDGGYRGGFYVTALCYDRKGNQKGGDSWKRETSVKTYEETRLGARFLADTVSFPISSGKYTLKVEISDLYSQRVGEKSTAVQVPDFRSGGLALSGLEFLAPSGTTRVFKPDRTYDGSFPLFVSFEIYCFYFSSSPLSRQWRVEDEAGKLVLRGDSQVQLSEGYKRDSLEVDIESLSPGEYLIIVSVQDEEKKERTEVRGGFFYQPPIFLSNKGYLKLVEQLEYIAKPGELKKLKEAKPEERERLWREFWKDKDPSPGTERNERREEYFRRVRYANRHFSALQEGWKTDMGRIHIVYGKPDEIERHPFDLDSPPYEVWYYYGVGLKFVFVDEHNLGDYKLVYPREGTYRRPKFN